MVETGWTCKLAASYFISLKHDKTNVLNDQRLKIGLLHLSGS